MKKNQNFTLLIISLLFILFFLLPGQFGQTLRDKTSYLTKPIMQVFAGSGHFIKDKINLFREIGRLKKENQFLAQENIELRGKLAKLQEVEKENEIFHKELKLAPRQKYKLEPALIVGQQGERLSKNLYINKGKRDGLKENMAVLVGKGALIGKLVVVEDKISKLQLITDNNFRVNGKIVESGGQGVVSGEYGTSVVMKMIPQTVEVKKGYTVVTSELSDSLPPNLLIGYIEEVNPTPDQLFQEAIIIPPRDLNDLYLVWVVKE